MFSVKQVRGIISLIFAATFLFNAEFNVLAADPKNEAGTFPVIDYGKEETSLERVLRESYWMAVIAEDTQYWNTRALANTDTSFYVYEEASEESRIVGVMYPNTAADVEKTDTGWTRVTSGNVTGYVKDEQLLYGIDATRRVRTVCSEGIREIEEYTEKIMLVKAVSPDPLPEHVLRAVPEFSDAADVAMMACIIYCEAGDQPYEGQVAVGAVVMNRVASPIFPNTIREVLYQEGQFTPVMTGKFDRKMESGKVPEVCYKAARDAMSGVSPIGNMMFFNTHDGIFKLGDHWFH